MIFHRREYLIIDLVQVDCDRILTPLPGDTKSSGIFSLAINKNNRWVIVGGDYLNPNDAARTAAHSKDGKVWIASQTPPHGYRSSVAYDSTTKTWITVGPNGTDISTDEGKNWRPLHPKPGQPPDADRNWNALSLPFVVGPYGRIGKLRNDALKP